MNNTFGIIENKNLIIYCYSEERKFERKDIRRIFVQKYRGFHYNLSSFFLAIGILSFFKSDELFISIICILLFVFSFFYKKIIHKLIILEKESFVNFEIKKQDVKEAEILIDLFMNKNSNSQ